MPRKASLIIPGKQLRALLQAHNVTGNEGAKLAGDMLHVLPATIQQWYTRGIRLNDYELLELKLKDRQKHIRKIKSG